MPQRIRPSTSSPSTLTEQRLFTYVLTAGAGMLAAATPADAGVIYVNPPDQTYTNQSFSLDLNSDGFTDAWFNDWGYNWGSYFYRNLFASALGLAGSGLALSPSMIVGPAGQFGPNGFMAGVWQYTYTGKYYLASGGAWGPWANVTDRFLGLQFQIGPNTHYGWVRMDVSADWPNMTIAATVKDWAYESLPGVGIHAGSTGGEIPEPGTLSLLALGAAGLAAWRRRKPRTS